MSNTAPPKTEKEPTLTGIPHYDNIVFPKIERGEKTFNWLAAFFPTYWLPYKGLWKIYFSAYFPIVFFSAFSPSLALLPLLGLFIFTGFKANKFYYDSCKTKPNNSGNVAAGIAGLILAMVFAVFSQQFAEEFIPAFKASYNAAYNQTTNHKLARSEKIYTQSSLAVMDGEDAIGNTLRFAAAFYGVQTIDGHPAIQAIDSNGGTMWWIIISEEHKATVAQMRLGRAYTFECVIEKIDLVMNVCSLR